MPAGFAEWFAVVLCVLAAYILFRGSCCVIYDIANWIVERMEKK